MGIGIANSKYGITRGDTPVIVPIHNTVIIDGVIQERDIERIELQYDRVAKTYSEAVGYLIGRAQDEINGTITRLAKSTGMGIGARFRTIEGLPPFIELSALVSK